MKNLNIVKLMKDPHVQERMMLARRSFTGRKWKNKADKTKYTELVYKTISLRKKGLLK